MNIKLTYEHVKEMVEKEGYKLISKEYRNIKTKLELMCPKGHKFKMIWNGFQQNQRCPICAGNQKHSYEYIKEFIEKEGYKLLSKEYKNANTKLKLECTEGHKFWMRWSHFKKNHRCHICYKNSLKLTYEKIKEGIEKEGYKLLSKEYRNCRAKLELECDKGHKFFIRWNNFQQGQRCSTCYKLRSFSKGEKEVLEYIQSITDTIIVENDKTQIINPKTNQFLELDIFLPGLKKAIEYNGTYWHSDDYSKYKDKQKELQCEELGIDLLVIQDDNWINGKKDCKDEIKYFIIRN